MQTGKKAMESETVFFVPQLLKRTARAMLPLNHGAEASTTWVNGWPASLTARME
jgi:hypothetical protein